MQVRARDQDEAFAVEVNTSGEHVLFVRPSLVMGPSAIAALDAILRDAQYPDAEPEVPSVTG